MLNYSQRQWCRNNWCPEKWVQLHMSAPVGWGWGQGPGGKPPLLPRWEIRKLKSLVSVNFPVTLTKMADRKST